MVNALVNASAILDLVRALFFEFDLVDDEIVIKLLKKEVEQCEKNGHSWVLQGFPRTKVQALSIKQMRIVPDKLIHLNIRNSSSIQKIRQNIVSVNQKIFGKDLQDLA